MLLTKPEVANKAITAAEKAGVPPELVCAIIEVSSGWDASMREWAPTRWLLDQHPVDFGGDLNWVALGFRWGAMQVSGQEAWQAGYKDLGSLREVDGSMEAGCLVLKKILSDDLDKTVSLWFGRERRNLSQRTLAVLPQCKAFVEARPCVTLNS